MASPGNRHCANCIGTLSFRMVVARHPYMCKIKVRWTWCQDHGLISWLKRAKTNGWTNRRMDMTERITLRQSAAKVWRTLGIFTRWQFRDKR